jgi:hypothetical protein
MNQALWDESGVREDQRGYVVAQLGAVDGVLAFDETGGIKQGRHTVGVARQYTGVTGQVENCPVSVHARVRVLARAGPRRRRVGDGETDHRRGGGSCGASGQAAVVPLSVSDARPGGMAAACSLGCTPGADVLRG